MSHPTEEILDLVDENDQVIGKLARSAVYERGLKNFRVINAFIRNSKNQIWIPRRTAGKRLFPLCLDMSVGGHVETGEAYELAFGRELEEELGLKLSEIKYRELGKLTPHKDDVSAFMTVYEIQFDEAPDYNKNDFVEYFWLNPADLIELLESGKDQAKSDLIKLTKYFYSK